MIEKFLAFLFPPKLDPVRDWNPKFGGQTEDGNIVWTNIGYLEPCEGSCSAARPKKYRDALHRVSIEGE